MQLHKGATGINVITVDTKLKQERHLHSLHWSRPQQQLMPSVASGTHRRRLRHDLVRQHTCSSRQETAEEITVTHDDGSERTFVVEVRGGRIWHIVVDSPSGHRDSPLVIVPGIERECDEDEEVVVVSESEEESGTAATAASPGQFLRETELMTANNNRLLSAAEEDELLDTGQDELLGGVRRPASPVTSDNPDWSSPSSASSPDAPLPIVQVNPEDPTKWVGDDSSAMVPTSGEEEDEESLLEGFGARPRPRGKPNAIRKFFRTRFGGRKKKDDNLVFIIDDGDGHGSMLFDQPK